MIRSVIGLVNSTSRAAGRMMQLSSVTSKTVGAVVSQASQTMQPGSIQTFTTCSFVGIVLFAYTRFVQPRRPDPSRALV
jgi:hypothetical protein